MMVCKCPRCEYIQSCDYDDRHLAVCIVCLRFGFMVHMGLIPKVMIDPEEPATTIDQYLTWDEYCDRLKPEQGTETTGNVQTAKEQ